MAGCKDGQDEGVLNKMKPLLKRLLGFLSSKELLIWLVILWIVYYLTAAIWWKEAFAHFVISLKNNPVSQGLYAALITNLAIRLVRTLKKGQQAFRKAPLLLGFLIFLIGFFLSAITKNVNYVIMGEGERYSPLWEDYTLYVDKVNAPIKEMYLDQERR